MPADRFGPDPERSYTLTAPHYYDPGIFRLEREAIFCRAWNLVCHADSLRAPGDYATATIGDQNIVAIRGKDGSLRAFYNVCQHRGHELLRGAGNRKAITCPYHAWSYHADGRLRSARGSERVAGFDKAEFCLKQVRIEEFCTFVFVNLDAEAAPLASRTGALEDEIRGFAPRIDDLTFSHRLTYDLAANWKNVIENFLECYHCPVAHRDFAANLVDIETYRIVTHDIHHSHSARAKAPARAAYDFDPANSDHGQELGVWFLWPNLGFEVYPGGYLNIFHVVPMGPERSLEHVDFYFFDKDPTEDQRAVIRYRDETVQAPRT